MDKLRSLAEETRSPDLEFIGDDVLTYGDAREIVARLAPVRNVCTWTEDVEGLHETTCGNAFQFYANGPTENGFTFCPYCGGDMKDQPYVWEADEDEECERATANGIEQELEESGR
jgi:hypothetical protein